MDQIPMRRRGRVLNFNMPLRQSAIQQSKGMRIPLAARVPEGAVLIRFFKNGNPYCKGIVVSVSKRNYKTMENLMEDLTEKFARKMHLQRPIEKLLNPNGKPIRDFQQFMYENICVGCYRHEKFVKLKTLQTKNNEFKGRLKAGREQRFQSILMPPLPPQFKCTAATDIDTDIPMRFQAVCGPLGLAMFRKYFIWRQEAQLSHMANVVFLQHRFTGVNYAVKSVDRIQIDSQSDWPTLPELETLRALQGHANIINLVMSYQNRKCVMLWFHKLDCDLYQFHGRFRWMPTSLVSRIFIKLANGLLFIHSHGIIHRDIKLRNILIRLRGAHDIAELKICDFGLSTSYEGRPLMETCGTPPFISPEMLANRGYDYKVDCWATGIVLYYLNYSHFPFKSNVEIMTKPLYKSNNFYRPLHPSMLQLLQNLLKKNPSERFSSLQMVQYDLATLNPGR